MCGIYLTNHKLTEEKTREKLNKIKYRGPDYQGFTQFYNLTFGHNRLSIIDLDSRSHQPMKENDYSIVFNGEIYNYKSVKRKLENEGVVFHTASDTEVLLKGFIAWGEDILQEVNGMFAFAIYNQRSNQVFAARDRLGVKPLYYSWQEGMLEICSQLSPMDSSDELDDEAIAIFLETGYIPSPKSIYRNIKKLIPGTYTIFDLNLSTFKNVSFWDLNKVAIRKITYNQAKKELHELLIDAVLIRLQSDVSHGCFLSGGIDSALVASLASANLKSPLNTFTIGFEEAQFDESKIARTFSEHLGTNHKTQVCTQKDLLSLIDTFFKVYDEPFADSSAIPSLLLNKVTKPNATVVLSGDGGDESFLGYNHFLWIKKLIPIFMIPHLIRKMVVKGFPFRLLGKRGNSIKNILGYKRISDFIQHIFTGFDPLSTLPQQTWFKHYQKYLHLSAAPLQQAADLNLRFWLENDSNVKVDRASMAYSVEVRSPFLDYRIIEFARSLPIHYRFGLRGVRKKILKDILQEYIPKSLFDKPKKGFSIPLGKWICNELNSEIKYYLSDDKLDRIPHLNKKKFKWFLENHFKEKADYSTYIWRVYVMSKWMSLNTIKASAE
jgi:asparagine synthase (glutamine-hydrolysing)